jgi:hypothetical protein
MTLIHLLGALLATISFSFLATALGHRLLRLCQLALDSNLEHLLCSGGVGVVALEIGLFVVQPAPSLRIGFGVVLVIALVLSGPDFAIVYRRARDLLCRLRENSPREKSLSLLAALILVFEGISAMAPLTGSDALMNHFGAPLKVLRAGFHPDFFLVPSFWCGQSHLLILAGLSAGSEKLAMGLILLGGAWAAAAVFCLARIWMSQYWAFLAALSFLLTPVVFWQMSAAGAPDIWMCFFATMAVILLARTGANPRLSNTFLVGIFAGAVAGSKYLDCSVALGVAISFLWENRTWRGAGMFLTGALCAGIWPYFRNWAWTGDPMFPFLMPWLNRSGVNAYTLDSLVASGGGHGLPSALNVFRFALFAGAEPQNPGLWQFLGPLPLAFIPFLPLAVRNTRAWRSSLIVWLVSAFSMVWATRTQRYLLAVFPIALAAVFAGVAHLDELRWSIARVVTRTIVLFALFAGAGGLVLYSHNAFTAAIGLTSPYDYLLRRAPNYQQTDFVNRTLGTISRNYPENKVLVFWRHVYYLDVPYLEGDPSMSWNIDPLRFQTTDEWRSFFRDEHIAWVVRAPAFPDTIAQPLQALETQGILVPMAQSDVSDFTGMRITGGRVSSQIVILQVRE